MYPKVRLAGVSMLLPILAGLVRAQDSSGNAVRLDIRGANFTGTNMRGANLAGADVSGAVFRRANVSEVSFWRTRIDNADFRGVQGLTPQQLSAAVWDPKQPPRLDTDLNSFRGFWDKKRMAAKFLGNANWWGKDLSEFDFVGADLRGTILIGANLRGATLQRANLHGVFFQGADISGADLRGAKGLTPGQLVSATWDTRKPPAVDSALRAVLKRWKSKQLVGEQLAGAHLWLEDLSGANLTGADLRRAVMIGANLKGAILRDAKLESVVWTGADLTGADLRGATGMHASMLYSARWDAKNPPILGTKLNAKREFFDKGRLARESLIGANLWGADLAGADLVGATMRDVVLIDANLRGAFLGEADLTGAILTRADISGADLRSAKGFGVAQLLSARWDEKRPPRLRVDLALFVKLWAARDLSRRSIRDASLWGGSLVDMKFRGADLFGVAFVGTQLRGANLSYTKLRGASFLGADISGVDFRGARYLTGKMILSASWDPKSPPVFDQRFNVLRTFAQHKRFEFDLEGACLQGDDPAGVMGPVRSDDLVASFSPSRPPRLGLIRLIQLIREGKFKRLRITR